MDILSSIYVREGSFTSRNGSSFDWLDEAPTEGKVCSKWNSPTAFRPTAINGRGIMRSASDATDMVSPSVVRGDFSKIRVFRKEADHTSSCVRFIAPLDDELDDLESIALTPREKQDLLVKSEKSFRRIGSEGSQRISNQNMPIMDPFKAVVRSTSTSSVAEPPRIMRDPSYELGLDKPKRDSIKARKRRSDAKKSPSWFKPWAAGK